MKNKIIFFYGVNASGKSVILNYVARHKDCIYFPIQCRLIYICEFNFLNRLLVKENYTKVINFIEKLNLFSEII